MTVSVQCPGTGRHPVAGRPILGPDIGRRRHGGDRFATQAAPVAATNDWRPRAPLRSPDCTTSTLRDRARTTELPVGRRPAFRTADCIASLPARPISRASATVRSSASRTEAPPTHRSTTTAVHVSSPARARQLDWNGSRWQWPATRSRLVARRCRAARWRPRASSGWRSRAWPLVACGWRARRRGVRSRPRCVHRAALRVRGCARLGSSLRPSRCWPSTA